MGKFRFGSEGEIIAQASRPSPPGQERTVVKTPRRKGGVSSQRNSSVRKAALPARRQVQDIRRSPATYAQPAI